MTERQRFDASTVEGKAALDEFWHNQIKSNGMECLTYDENANCAAAKLDAKKIMEYGEFCRAEQSNKIQ